MALLIAVHLTDLSPTFPAAGRLLDSGAVTPCRSLRLLRCNAESKKCCEDEQSVSILHLHTQYLSSEVFDWKTEHVSCAISTVVCVLRKLRRSTRVPCWQEAQNYLACCKKNDFDDAECEKEREQLQQCMKSTQEQQNSGSSTTLNYHLLRLSKQFSRGRGS
jgi:hypothetical protein